ncbi:hypothetical protein PRZ48_010526 [Zasmidium cellare]|uniref:tripeptidyl-peptidase II n=1 Tax=Zasmidium cellare TaxID=395010 RepID=A0ABR0E9F7_ZASCE|nr:hypothetical protein PRZ48_010526 [Zasmidium cellare]
MYSLLTLFVFASATHALTVPAWSSRSTYHEQIDKIPAGWSYKREAEKHEMITLRAYIRHSHRDYLQIAEDVSDPESPRYGQHLSAEELVLALPDASTSAHYITSWLDRNDIQGYEISSDHVQFETTVGKADELFSTKFASYQYLDEEPVMRTQNYSLPVQLEEHVDFVYPTVHFFAPKQRLQTRLEERQHVPTGPANCSNSVCPPQLKKQYNINYRPADNKSGSKIGIAGFLDTFPNVTDLKSFLSQYGAEKKADFPAYNVVSINRGRTTPTPNRGDLTVEPELDLDYALAFTGPLDVTFYSTGGRGTQLSQPGNKTVSPSGNEPQLEFLQYILAQKTPPQVISISYSDDEQSVPQAYARLCDLFAQAAARGISVISSSGDGGASGSGGNTACKGPDGKCRFIPTFPASCPWVTSVGATAGFGGTASFSSGGLSNYFARPSWQMQNVTEYIKELNGKHKGLYNASGRGIPDVSLLGDDYLSLTGGLPSTHDGTSASTPVFAAMVALINDIRLRNKKPALGLLNPLLYAAKAKSVFRDVQDGSESIGCADGNFFESGWEALKGWDAATGLGEPDFEKLRGLLA